MSLPPNDVTRSFGQQTSCPPDHAHRDVAIGQHFVPQQPRALQQVVPQQLGAFSGQHF
jgi:hypothetical protein